MTSGWTDDLGRWHADDCFFGCDGCGWIDAAGLWWPGPCPEDDQEAQEARSLGLEEPA